MPTAASLIGLTLIGLAELQAPAGSNANTARPEALAVSSQVHGLATIAWLRPAGSFVKKGEVICRFDPSRPRARLEAQGVRIESHRRRASQATLQREAAELALAEQEALADQEKTAKRMALQLAATTLELAEARLSEAKAARPPSPGRVTAALKEVEDARQRKAEVEAEARKFETVAIPARQRDLLKALDEARLQEKASLDAVAREVEAATVLERELEACTITAPGSGILAYARWRAPGDERGYAPVEVGAYVRFGQVLFRILPDETGLSNPAENASRR